MTSSKYVSYWNHVAGILLLIYIVFSFFRSGLLFSSAIAKWLVPIVLKETSLSRAWEWCELSALKYSEKGREDDTQRMSCYLITSFGGLSVFFRFRIVFFGGDGVTYLTSLGFFQCRRYLCECSDHRAWWWWLLSIDSRSIRHSLIFWCACFRATDKYLILVLRRTASHNILETFIKVAKTIFWFTWEKVDWHYGV